jgi:hypothetical protein
MPRSFGSFLSVSLLVAAAIVLELGSSGFAQRLCLTSEVLVLLGLWALAPLAWLRRGLIGLCVFIALTQIDRQAFLRLMGEEPLLYDQLFMLRHLAVLLMDMWSGAYWLWLCGGLALCGALGFALRSLLRRARADLDGRALPARLGVAAALCALALVLGHWSSPKLYADWIRSRALYASVQADVGASPYAAYKDIELARKPDVYWMFVESYGRVLFEEAKLRPGFSAALAHSERAFSEAGYSSVSGFSGAPVMGGRSWLAAGTVMFGMRVPYETLFHHLVSQIERVPNMVSFFAAHGYETLLLAPVDRPRLGVEDVNYYGYQRSLNFPQLQYHGARWGWGIVPDQYSLGYLSSQPTAANPRFVDVRLVTAHASWDPPPPLVDDWRSLNALGSLPELGNEDSPLTSMQVYTDKERRFPYEGALDDSMGARYQATIVYDLQVLERFVASLPREALVVIMGDHQPPFIAAETQSFDTPVHVLARDPALLEEFSAHGFTRGLMLAPGTPAATRHEALFSLLVRALSQGRSGRATLPAYQPLGARLGG